MGLKEKEAYLDAGLTSTVTFPRGIKTSNKNKNGQRVKIREELLKEICLYSSSIF